MAGRPSKYKAEYCQQLIDHMASGLSFECFAGVIGVCEDTLFEWVKTHPEFSESKKEGFARSRLVWEKIGLGGAAGKVRDFNATAFIFNMKNRFPREWRDKHDIQHTGPGDGPIKYENLTEEEVQRRIQEALKVVRYGREED